MRRATSDPEAVPYQSSQWTDAICASGTHVDHSRAYEMPDGRTLVHFMERYHVFNPFMRLLLEQKVHHFISKDNDKLVRQGIEQARGKIGVQNARVIMGKHDDVTSGALQPRTPSGYAAKARRQISPAG